MEGGKYSTISSIASIKIDMFKDKGKEKNMNTLRIADELRPQAAPSYPQDDYFDEPWDEYDFPNSHRLWDSPQ